MTSQLPACTAEDRLSSVARLLEDLLPVTHSLVDVVEHGSATEAKRAARALRVNARTVNNLLRHAANPPSFAYFLHREPLAYGGEEWTVHT